MSHVARMLGGTSSINYMVFSRGNRHDSDEWTSHGNPGWEYENVLPYYKKYEANQNETLVVYMNGKYHNPNGPLQISNGALSPVDEVIIAAMREAGAPFIYDINADKMFGYTMLQSTAYNNRRSSTAEAFLVPAKDRPNLHVIKHAFVDKVLINDNNEAYGVEFMYKEKHKMRAYSKKEVIVSAGTLQSPPLLMRSGIGPKEHLKKHKISVKADLAVGDNHIDHVFAFFLITTNISTSPLSIGATIALDSWYQYTVDNIGVLVLHHSFRHF